MYNYYEIEYDNQNDLYDHIVCSFRRKLKCSQRSQYDYRNNGFICLFLSILKSFRRNKSITWAMKEHNMMLIMLLVDLLHLSRDELEEATYFLPYELNGLSKRKRKKI